MTAPAPYGAAKPAKPEPPEQVVGAWQAWLATCVLQAAAAMTTLAINLMNPGALIDVAGQGLGGGMAGTFADLGPDEKILVARGSAVMTMVLALIAVAAFAFLAFRMRAGAKWARLLLVAGSAYLFVKAAVMVLGGPAGPWAQAPTPLQLGDGALTIASACAAGAAVALVSGRAALEYFGSDGKRSGQGGKSPGGNGEGPGGDGKRPGGDGRKDGGHGR